MNTSKERISLNMSVQEAVLAIAGGNPGAINVCITSYQKYEACDPDSAFKGLTPILAFDTHKVYESKVWVLYKDVCKQKYINVFALIRACQLGLLPYDTIEKAIEAADAYKTYPIDFEKVIASVKEKLPAFGVGFNE